MRRRLSSWLLDIDNSAALWFWFVASVGFAGGIAWIIMQPVFSGPYTIQDDARHHVFWMLRWADPQLFPDDRIADYFQTMAPLVYKAVYLGFNELGIDPLSANRLLPLPLTLITAVFAYLATLRICPAPIAGFLATTFLTCNLWIKDDLPSATPRAFVFPLLLAFLFFLSRRSFVGCTIALVLLAGIYPTGAMICIGALGCWLVTWSGNGPRLRQGTGNWIFAFAMIGVGVASLLPFVLATKGYGPIIHVDLARTWGEFQDRGRTRFFFDDPVVYWLCAPRSGYVPTEWCRYLTNFQYDLPRVYLASFLSLTLVGAPFLLRGLMAPMFRDGDNSAFDPLIALILSSTVGFFLAHALLFEMHLPSRYSQHTLRILGAITFGVSAAVLLRILLVSDRFRLLRRRTSGLVVGGFFLLLLPIGVFGMPAIGKDHPFQVKYAVGEYPQLYQYLSFLPPDILVASLSREMDNIPIFARRKVLFSHEVSIPYHLTYYGPMRQDILDFIDAQYSPDLRTMQTYVKTHGITHIVLHLASFEARYVRVAWWRRQFPEKGDAVLNELRRGLQPAMLRVLARCARGRYGNLLVIGAGCLVNLDPDTLS